MAKAPPLPRPVPVASSSSGSQAWVLVSTSLSVSITTIHPVILCFLDPNRREKELVLHHGNALHQVRPGTGDGLGMVEEVWPGSQAEDGVEVGGCRGQHSEGGHSPFLPTGWTASC